MRIKEAMKTSVKTITADRPLDEAADLMKRFGIQHLVVMEHGAVVGILSDGDIARHEGRGLVGTAMTRGVITVDVDDLISRAANVMRGKSIECLVVTHGTKLAGVITTNDLLEIMGQTGHRERMVLRDRGRRHSRARS
ncbi:MAG TPA: CBS domain-containing protein [Thermoanaerobaculia bacterium]|nr:CBS domain-containing protein [Thermoanaerobaculia bacterium]